MRRSDYYVGPDRSISSLQNVLYVTDVLRALRLVTNAVVSGSGTKVSFVPCTVRVGRLSVKSGVIAKSLC